MSFFFSTTKYSSSVSTTAWLASGHDGTDGMIIGGSGKLILSASNGVVHISGATDIGLSPDNKNYHIRAVNSHLILSSSAGSITAVSGNLLALSGVYFGGNSSADITLLKINTNAIRFLGGTGANTAVVSALRWEDTGQTTTVAADEVGQRLTGRFYWSNSTSAYNTAREMSIRMGRYNQLFTVFPAATGTVCFSSSISGISTTLTSGKGNLILSGTEGSIISFSGAQDFTETNQAYNLRTVNSHLVLSSSIGSVVRISGALSVDTVATANLLAGVDVLSGAIMWDTTRKCLRVYSAEGWVSIATGSTA